jgi:hypothetical protein
MTHHQNLHEVYQLANEDMADFAFNKKKLHVASTNLEKASY